MNPIERQIETCFAVLIRDFFFSLRDLTSCSCSAGVGSLPPALCNANCWTRDIVILNAFWAKSLKCSVCSTVFFLCSCSSPWAVKQHTITWPKCRNPSHYQAWISCIPQIPLSTELTNRSAGPSLLRIFCLHSWGSSWDGCSRCSGTQTWDCRVNRSLVSFEVFEGRPVKFETAAMNMRSSILGLLFLG